MPSTLFDAIKADGQAVKDTLRAPLQGETTVPETTLDTTELPWFDPECTQVEPAQFIWPKEGSLKELKLEARIQQLDADLNKEEHVDLRLEVDLLRKFQKNQTLGVVDDICITIEEAFGISPVAEAEGIDQKTIYDCYALIGRICNNLMSDLEFTEHQPGCFGTTFTIRKQPDL